jgi:ABC-2 type transporter
MTTTYFFGDTAVLLGRSMRHITRSLDTIITVTIMPIALMLLFVYVFGGAIHTGSHQYVNYLLPGILLITIAMGISYTAVRLFTDMKSGIFERFQSMPIARSSALWAHVLTSVVANLISLALVVLVAVLMGFRSGAGVLAWLAVAGILVLFTLALTWIAVIAGSEGMPRAGHHVEVNRIVHDLDGRVRGFLRGLPPILNEDRRIKFGPANRSLELLTRHASAEDVLLEGLVPLLRRPDERCGALDVLNIDDGQVEWLVVTAARGPEQLSPLLGGDCLPEGGQHRFPEDQVSSTARHADQAVPGGVNDVGVVTRAGEGAAFPGSVNDPSDQFPRGEVRIGDLNRDAGIGERALVISHLVWLLNTEEGVLFGSPMASPGDVP